MAVGTSWLATDPALPAVLPVSLVDLAGHRVTVPRASPRRGAAVWAPLHSVCVLLARPMFRGTRLPGACYVVHLVVSRRSADCGPACWARAHRGTAHADVLSGNARRGAADRVPALRSLWYLTTSLHMVATMAPGFLGTWVAWPFISRSCPPVVSPWQEVSNKEVTWRSVACTGRCGGWAPSVLASGCSCEVM